MIEHGEGLGTFVLKVFASFQIPPLGASPGSSLGHTEQAEDGCGHAALSKAAFEGTKAEVRGTESWPDEGGTVNSVLVSLHGWDMSQGSSGHGRGQSLPALLPWGGVGWAFNGLVHLKQRETVLQVHMCFSDVQGAMPGSWGGVREWGHAKAAWGALVVVGQRWLRVRE